MSDSCIISLENQWKTKTNAANELFNENRFNAALDNYNNALYKAEALNLHSNDCQRAKVPFIQIFVISCNNIANTFEELGDFKAADNMLKRSIYYLLSLVNNKNIRPGIIESELKRATLAYSNFMDKQCNETSSKKQVFQHLKDEFLKNGCKIC